MFITALAMQLTLNTEEKLIFGSVFSAMFLCVMITGMFCQVSCAILIVYIA